MFLIKLVENTPLHEFCESAKKHPTDLTLREDRVWGVLCGQTHGSIVPVS
jgi:hypothetical protein